MSQELQEGQRVEAVDKEVDEPEYLTQSDLARKLGITPARIGQLIEAGRVLGVKRNEKGNVLIPNRPCIIPPRRPKENDPVARYYIPQRELKEIGDFILKGTFPERTEEERSHETPPAHKPSAPEEGDDIISAIDHVVRQVSEHRGISATLIHFRNC